MRVIRLLSRGRRIRAALLCVCLMLVGASSPEALYSEVDFRIPAEQGLDRALLQFSVQAGIALSVDAACVKGYRSPGVNGRMTPAAALAILLRESGLVFRTVGSTVTVVREGKIEPTVSAGSDGLAMSDCTRPRTVAASK